MSIKIRPLFKLYDHKDETYSDVNGKSISEKSQRISSILKDLHACNSISKLRIMESKAHVCEVHYTISFFLHFPMFFTA